MTLRARNIVGYALIKPSTALAARNIVGYALLKVKDPLPTGKTGKDALKELFVKAASEDITGLEITVGEPIVESGPSETNTRAEFRLEDHSGRMSFYYTRRPLEDAWIAVAIGSRSVAGLTNTSQLLGWLSDSSGMMLEARDLVNEPIVAVNGKVTLTAADSSYFFIPGTKVTFATV